MATTLSQDSDANSSQRRRHGKSDLGYFLSDVHSINQVITIVFA